MTCINIPLSTFPVPRVDELESGVCVLPPLSRRGMGPGMITILPDGPPSSQILVDGVPSPSMKWVEEGYTVVEIRGSALERGYSLSRAIEALAQHDQCTPKGIIGLVG